MKRLFGYVLVSAALVMPVVALAAEFRLDDQPAVRSSERIVGDIYLFGSSVTSAGQVTGDVVAGGGTVIINGAVGADVIAGGGNVSILGAVADDVRVGGGTVIIESKVGGDVIIGGGQVTVGGEGIVGDVVMGGGTIRIGAPVGGTLRVGGGTVYIDAPIKGDVFIEADQVTLGRNAVVGNITYTATKKLVQEDGAVVSGSIQYTPREKRTPSAESLLSAWAVGKFFALLACGLFLGLVFRRYTREIVVAAVHRPFFELGRGFLVAIIMPIVSVLLLVTVVGIPLGVLGLLGYVAGLVLACLVAPIILGSVTHHYVFKKEGWEVSWQTILLGVVIYMVLGVIPFVGSLIHLVLGLVALGAMTTIKWQLVKEWR